jgi:hypothetical protein
MQTLSLVKLASDIDTAVVDSLTCLTPDGRLEKRTCVCPSVWTRMAEATTLESGKVPLSRDRPQPLALAAPVSDGSLAPPMFTETVSVFHGGLVLDSLAAETGRSRKIILRFRGGQNIYQLRAKPCRGSLGSFRYS